MPQGGGAESSVDDLGLSRGDVLSRAAALLRSVESQPYDWQICTLQTDTSAPLKFWSETSMRGFRGGPWWYWPPCPASATVWCVHRQGGSFSLRPSFPWEAFSGDSLHWRGLTSPSRGRLRLGPGIVGTCTESKPRVLARYSTSHALGPRGGTWILHGHEGTPISLCALPMGKLGPNFSLLWGPAAGTRHQSHPNGIEAWGLSKVPHQSHFEFEGWNIDSDWPRGHPCQPLCITNGEHGPTSPSRWDLQLLPGINRTCMESKPGVLGRSPTSYALSLRGGTSILSGLE